MTDISMKSYMQGVTPTREYTGEVPGGRLEVIITTQRHDLGNRRSTMRLWVKHGYLTKAMPETLHVDTYFYDDEGNCWGRFNPTAKEEGGRMVLDFDWMLPPSDENEARIVAEAFRRARLDARKAR